MIKKIVLLLLILILSACSKSRVDETQISTSTEVPNSQVILIAKEKLAIDQGIPVDQVALEKIEEVTFPDSCLGIISEGMDCSVESISGYKITLSSGEMQFIYHSNLDGTQVEMAYSEVESSDLSNHGLPNAVSAAKLFLSNELVVKQTLIKVISYDFRNWPDGCLGLGEKGEMCIQVVIPGYYITLEYEGQAFRLRTDQNGSLIKIDLSKPQPAVQDS